MDPRAAVRHAQVERDPARLEGGGRGQHDGNPELVRDGLFEAQDAAAAEDQDACAEVHERAALAHRSRELVTLLGEAEQRNADAAHASKAVKGKSLREQVVASLRWSIFIGELPPGRQFSVPVLAGQFGVSPTPVREAVLDLVQQGLVVALANRGFQVVAPSMDYLREAMHVRRLLEIPAMTDIARIATPAQLKPVQELAEAIMQAAVRGDIRHRAARPCCRGARHDRAHRPHPGRDPERDGRGRLRLAPPGGCAHRTRMGAR